MATELTWLGHASWSIQTGDHKILLDPFLNDNPKAPIPADEAEADVILISHGHFDHIADAASIARRTNAQVVSNFEIAQWLTANHNVSNTLGMNLGGSVKLPFGRLKMTNAWHSSALPDGSYGGNPGGFLLDFDDARVYFACDTALFSDMKLIGDCGVDVAVLPIGDLFTMGPEDAVIATQLIRPKFVLPNHFGTWPPIEQDAEAWSNEIKAQTEAQPVVLEPGQSFSIPA